MPAKMASAVVPSPASTISLRIKHPSIDPGAITAELGLSPDHAWACGEPRQPPAGARSGIRRNSYWSATLLPVAAQTHWAQVLASNPQVARAAETLRGMVPDVATQLSLQLWQLRRSQTFLERLLSEGGEVAFVIEIDPNAAPGFRLPASLARQLGALGVTLEFEFM